jgi:Tfp pilus assembly protein PilF
MTSSNTSGNTIFTKRRDIWVFILLTVAIAAVFLQLPGHDFVDFDDGMYVTRNPQVRNGLTLEGIIWSFGLYDSPYWQPLTWISHMLDCQLFGLDPGMHHLTNLVLHLANSLLLLLFFKRTTGSLWKSSFVAALFALHPLSVESVAWVSSRKNLLSTFFWMLTMLSYVHYSKRPGLYRYLLTSLFFVLGLMAKPILVILPFALLLLDYWPLGRFRPGKPAEPADSTGAAATMTVSPGKSAFPLVAEKIPLLIFSLFSIYVTSLTLQLAGSSISTEQVPIKLRIASGLVSYVSYVTKMVWPKDLAVFYPYPTMVPMWHIVGAVILLLSVSILLLRVWRKKPYLVTGWLWYLGTMIPMIGLKQAGLWPAIADRYTYVPLIGLYWMISWGVPDLVANWRYQRTLLSFSAGLVLVLLMLCTRSQVKHWRDSVTLFEHTLRVTENNRVIHNNLGAVLIEQGRFVEAIPHFTKALQIRPEDVKAQINLAVSLANLGDLQKAVDHYSKALKLDPHHAGAHNNLGNVLLLQGRVDEAEAEFSRALEIRGDYAEAHNNLGVVLARQGRFTEAIEHFNQALRVNPHYPQARRNLDRTLRQIKQATTK